MPASEELKDGAAEARRVLNAARPPMTKQQHLDFMFMARADAETTLSG